MADSFAGFSSSGCCTLLHVLLAFQISTEKSAVILMVFPFFVTCVFVFCSLAAFNTLSLFCIFSILTMMCYREFLFVF